MPLFCTGYRGACTLAKNGGAISMRYPCSKCGQLRCRSHCQCARDGSLSGSSRGRPALRAVARAKAKAGAQPKVAAAPPPGQPAPPVLAVAPVGRAPALQADVMDSAAWWARLLQEVRHASQVVVATTTRDSHRPCCDAWETAPASSSSCWWTRRCLSSARCTTNARG